LRFEGLSRLSLTNFLPAHIQEFSIFVVFKSDYGTTNALLLGNDAGTQLSGPSFWSGGTPYIYADPENLSVTVSSNGLVVAEPTFHWANTFNWGDTSFPQFALVTALQTNLTIQADIDREYSTPFTNATTIANPGNSWFIGGRGDGSAAFKGTLYFAAIFNRALSETEFADLRHLYRATIGKGIDFPATQLVIEGDSLSEEVFNTEYGRWLHSSSNWIGRFIKRNIARVGEGTAQMLDEFSAEVPAVECANPYLFIWGGRNDLAVFPADQIFANLRAYWRRARQAVTKWVRSP